MSWTQAESSTVTIAFAAGFLLLAIWETRYPARPLKGSTERRWLSHGALLLAAAVVQSVVLRTSPVLVAISLRDASWGMLNRPWMPWILQAAATILLLDFVHYLTHRLFHAVGPLWRVHELHHSDTDYDVSVAVRFHPIEVVVTRAAQLGTIAIFCPPTEAVLGAELLSTVLNLTAHANITLPARLERVCRWIFITPDVHRIHHSSDPIDLNCNFGQSFVAWDRLFGTYRATSGAPSANFATGVPGLPEEGQSNILAMMIGPFRSGR